LPVEVELTFRSREENHMIVSFSNVWVPFVRGLLPVPRLGRMCAKKPGKQLHGFHPEGV
jgi:hypothetical protein